MWQGKAAVSLAADRLHAAASMLSCLAGWLSGAILIYMVAHTVLEIVLRNVFNRSTFVLDEFVGYGMAAITFLALGHALERGQLIRVNLLLGMLGGLARRLIELFCILATLAITVFAGWFFYQVMQRQWLRGAVSHSLAEVPLWIPYAIVLSGLGVFALQLIAYLLRILCGGAPYDSGSAADQREI